jgi:Transcriptional regulatory protein, C terminal
MSTPALFCRFGAFSLDVGQFELRRGGRTVRLERQAVELLILLVERRGQLVSRSEIVSRLWGDAVFIDVDTGVNTAVSKVRQALRDSAEAPTFVETVQRRGDLSEAQLALGYGLWRIDWKWQASEAAPFVGHARLTCSSHHCPNHQAGQQS